MDHNKYTYSLVPLSLYSKQLHPPGVYMTEPDWRQEIMLLLSLMGFMPHHHHQPRYKNIKWAPLFCMVCITSGVGREPLVLPPFVGAVSGPRLSLEIDQLILRGGRQREREGERGDTPVPYRLYRKHTLYPQYTVSTLIQYARLFQKVLVAFLLD